MESAANASEPVPMIPPTGLMSDGLAAIRPAIIRSPEPRPAMVGKAAPDVVTLHGSRGPAEVTRPLESALLRRTAPQRRSRRNRSRVVDAGAREFRVPPYRWPSSRPPWPRAALRCRDWPPIGCSSWPAGATHAGVRHPHAGCGAQGSRVHRAREAAPSRIGPVEGCPCPAFPARARRHLLSSTHLSWLACRLLTRRTTTGMPSCTLRTRATPAWTRPSPWRG